MNTGVEAVETAIKIARKWAYQVKRVSEGKARVVTCSGNFHGRTITAISASTDSVAREGFGPYLPLVGSVNPTTGKKIRFGNVDDLELMLGEFGNEIAAFLVEPIQGEAGYLQ